MLDAFILGLNLATYHFDRAHDYCETNPGIYVLHRESRLAGGIYRNSECNLSAWAAKQWGWGPLTLSVGAVVGYSRAAVLPLVVPSLKLGPARLSLLPPVEKRGGGGLHLSIEKSF